MKIKLDEIELKIKILEDKKTKAIIGLDFGDFVIRGFRITESKFPNMNGEMLWFMPPSYLGGGRYHPIFFLPDKELWQKLEKRVWIEYKGALNTQHKKKYGLKDGEWEGL
ncbi:MAG: hypothetical protein EXS46_02100 [Candidatus Taylorbacteria bacterium]|nr:hypothetical protein [Candidatus Taylorbacteria bacterium]